MSTEQGSQSENNAQSNACWFRLACDTEGADTVTQDNHSRVSVDTSSKKTIITARHNAQYISHNTSQTPTLPSKIQAWVNTCGGKRSCKGNDANEVAWPPDSGHVWCQSAEIIVNGHPNFESPPNGRTLPHTHATAHHNIAN